MDNAITVARAIEMTEELYGELIDSRTSNDNIGLDITCAADVAAERVGIIDRAAFVRSYVATRRHLQRLAPARDPFEDFAGV